MANFKKLSNILMEQLDKLSDDEDIRAMGEEEFKKEIARSELIVKLSDQVIKNDTAWLGAAKFAYEIKAEEPELSKGITNSLLGIGQK